MQAQEFLFDPTAQVSYGKWSCPECGSTFYGGGHAIHKAGCPRNRDRSYNDLVYHYTPKEAEQVLAGDRYPMAAPPGLTVETVRAHQAAAIAPARMPAMLRLQDGKKYKDGTGEVVKVVLAHPGAEFPFERCNGEPTRYMADGRYVEDAATAAAAYNLVEEVPEPAF